MKDVAPWSPAHRRLGRVPNRLASGKALLADDKTDFEGLRMEQSRLLCINRPKNYRGIVVKDVMCPA
jgi:hypothetical protein